MRNLDGWDWLSIVLVIIGGLNWGLIGFFRFDLVASVGTLSAISRIIYALVGLAALYLIFASPRYAVRQKQVATETHAKAA
jgi:hypothetical protein